MKTNSSHSSAKALMDTLRFTGLSGEQALLATLASQNPATSPSIRLHAKSLLLLNEGATVAEVSRQLSLSRRSISTLIWRFENCGFCTAVLGSHASQASRVWLSLSPASPPKVQFQRSGRSRKRTVDTATASATCTSRVIAAPLSSSKQACCCQTDVHQADPNHQGGHERSTPHA